MRSTDRLELETTRTRPLVITLSMLAIILYAKQIARCRCEEDVRLQKFNLDGRQTKIQNVAYRTSIINIFKILKTFFLLSHSHHDNNDDDDDSNDDCWLPWH
jgi:hypothetical protein